MHRLKVKLNLFKYSFQEKNYNITTVMYFTSASTYQLLKALHLIQSLVVSKEDSAWKIMRVNFLKHYREQVREWKTNFSDQSVKKIYARICLAQELPSIINVFNLMYNTLDSDGEAETNPPFMSPSTGQEVQNVDELIDLGQKFEDLIKQVIKLSTEGLEDRLESEVIDVSTLTRIQDVGSFAKIFADALMCFGGTQPTFNLLLSFFGSYVPNVVTAPSIVLKQLLPYEENEA